MSDYEGGVSPSGSPSSSPKHNKKQPRTHPPPSTDDESEGEMKKPSKSDIRFSCYFLHGRKSNLLYPVEVAEVSIFDRTNWEFFSRNKKSLFITTSNRRPNINHLVVETRNCMG